VYIYNNALNNEKNYNKASRISMEHPTTCPKNMIKSTLSADEEEPQNVATHNTAGDKTTRGSMSDEGMTFGSSILAYLVFGLGRASTEGMARPVNVMDWRGPGARLGV
jgi:hypothetical protein